MPPEGELEARVAWLERQALLVETHFTEAFWKALDVGDDGLPVWLGAAVFDDGLGVSHYTGQVTHHTAADIDAELRNIRPIAEPVH